MKRCRTRIPALLYEPRNCRAKSVILNVNGHDPNGSGALQADPVHQSGKAWNARVEPRMVRHGPIQRANVRALSNEPARSLRSQRLAPFYLAMKRGLDVLLALEDADPDRVAVTGLSGGGGKPSTSAPSTRE